MKLIFSSFSQRFFKPDKIEANENNIIAFSFNIAKQVNSIETGWKTFIRIYFKKYNFRLAMSTSILSLLDLIRIFICLLFLSIASLHDLKSREVPDTIWMIFAPLGLTLSLVSMVWSGWNLWTLLSWIMILAITFCLSITLFYLGLFGGADGKALICLAAVMPFRPSLPWEGPPARNFIQYFMPPPISTFNNAVLLATLSIIPILIRNLKDYAENKRLFDGLEHEGFFTKALAPLTGYRVDINRLRTGKHHYLLMEEFIRREDGSTIRKLKIFSRLPPDENWPKLDLPTDFYGKVWVTPGLPFIIFIALGFLITILVGDLILLLAGIIFTYH